MTLPADVHRLVRRHVHSVGELDLLVLLHRDRARAWTAEQVCKTLRCPWCGWDSAPGQGPRRAVTRVVRAEWTITDRPDDGRTICVA